MNHNASGKQPAAASKLLFIESLRGLAACQVLLLHYAAAFLPALVRLPGVTHFAAESWLSHSPLFLLMDGYSAVYLFFVMSGFVLAPSFLRAPQTTAALALKRYVRLFLPVLGAFCCAVLLTLALPAAKGAALMYSHSGWLDIMGHNAMTWQSLARDGLWNSMLAGYQDASVFSPWPAVAGWLSLTPVSSAMNSPMWTLHVEFWGSMLLIVVSRAARDLPAPLFWTLFLVLAGVAGSSHFLLFLAGFVLYRLRGLLLDRTGGMSSVAGALLVAAGLYACGSKQVPWLTALWQQVGHAGVLSADSDFHWQSQIGALLLFCGMLLCAPLRALLVNRVTLWLGRISFSLYLLHFPLLLTLGCLVFAALAPLSYGWACAASLAIGGGLTLVCAGYFERWVDRRAVAVSRRIGLRGVNWPNDDARV